MACCSATVITVGELAVNNGTRYMPISQWAWQYNRANLGNDLSAAFIVVVLLIPQSLAYALLAGVPAEVGLYASIFPLVVYAMFGTSRTLSVGPVAVVSLMTATALGKVAAQGSADYLSAAIALSLLSGVFLLVMGLFRLGFIANFLSHSVISGFITASAVIIALSQLKHIMGVSAQGDNVAELSLSLLGNIHNVNLATMAIGISVVLFLFFSKKYAGYFFQCIGFSKKNASSLSKAAPIVGVVASIVVAFLMDAPANNVALVGAIPSGLPGLGLTIPSWSLIQELSVPALLISIIGYVESVSVGKTLAAKRRQRIDTNQELIGLGVANIASSVSGAFPVTGGFSRSVVNFEAGAVTQAASIFAAIGIAVATLFLTPLLYFLPKATLAATIIVAVLSLVDMSIFKKTWTFAKSDFVAVLVTIIVTLILGVEVGVSCGIAASIALHLYRTSKPHIAEVGLIEGTEHFRNVRRYHVSTTPDILCLRPDESLFFANASYLEDVIYEAIFQRDQIAHVVLMCSAINEIDLSALEALEAINTQLREQGVKLHLSEVKGPVMDNLQRSGFLDELSGNIFLTQFDAFNSIKQSGLAL